MNGSMHVIGGKGDHNIVNARGWRFSADIVLFTSHVEMP
jgi:hypothetical protein